MGIIDKLKIKAGHSKLASKMLRKEGLTSSNMGRNYDKAVKTLKTSMAKGDMLEARKYAKGQRTKANSQGYTME